MSTATNIKENHGEADDSRQGAVTRVAPAAEMRASLLQAKLEQAAPATAPAGGVGGA